MLDRACLSGKFRWLRAGERQLTATIKSTTPICFIKRNHVSIWQRRRNEHFELSSQAHRVHQTLQQNGALYADEVVALGEMEEADVVQGLKELVGVGFVGCDGFNSLRTLVKGDGKALADAGRWSLYRRSGITAERSDKDIEAIAWVLLRRYGVVFRKVLERESPNIPSWRELLIAYRRLEARGEIRGGRFVAGFSGEQYALPEAVGSLRKVRRQGNTMDMVTISAADPMNLTGSIVPVERISISAKDCILLRDGIPIATQCGKDVRFMQTLDDNEQWQARNALVQHPIPLTRQAH